MQNKVQKVMQEFKAGTLNSSGGDKVTNPKQAVAIALSEQERSRKSRRQGLMKEATVKV